jgi:hypothetical protein
MFAACLQAINNVVTVFARLHYVSKYVASFFHMIRIICTPQKCSGFNQMEEAKS